MTIPVDIKAIRTAFETDLSRVVNEQDLQMVRDRYLGRKQGAVVALMKSVANAPPAERPVLGKASNELKREIDLALADRRKSLQATNRPLEIVDVTYQDAKCRSVTATPSL